MNNLHWIWSKRKFKRVGKRPAVPFRMFVKNHRYISIGDNFSCLWNTRLEAWDRYYDQVFTPELIIGNNVSINSDVHIGCINKVVIGNNVLMASRIFISDHSHGDITAEALELPPVQRKLVSKGPVIIEDGVWIGEGVSVLSGVTIGRDAIIGANAVVTQNVPPRSVVAGIPARVIKTL